MSYLIRTDLTKQVDIPEHPYTFPLDPFQKHAMKAIANHEHVLVCAKTGSGKTLVGEYQIYHSLKKGLRIFYTTPIKSLSNQKFYDLKHQYPTATVGIMTGDIKFCPNAQIIIMTTEILRNLLYKKGTSTEHLGITADLSLDAVDAVIFDECHYMNDKDRGMIWEETMILLPLHINMVMLSATLDHPEYVGEWLGQLKQKPVHLIETHYRIVPLSHHLIRVNKSEEYELVTLMDAKEVYHQGVYLDWLRVRKEMKDAEYKQKLEIKDGKKDSKEKKIHIDHFVYQLNKAIIMLEQQELLPAICFVLSRKLCEVYAKKIEKDLLTLQETAEVKHIISFHLHHHLSILEKTPQYHQLYQLLCKGIAYHHSGLLPLLKEIVEILFSKGFIKLLFCTETFAVGLNMPTKTVLFAGFKKYDELLDNMRVLRNDEYIQMAGRAGRRGKDDKGVVIYLPDKEPLEPYEMFTMMKGARPPITSKMTFHYDFILKTIHASTEPLKWLHIMKQSYWFQQRQIEIRELQDEKLKYNLHEITIEYEECLKRYELELKMKTHSNKKEIQRELTSLKNKQLGPKWNKAWADFQENMILKKKCDHLEERIQLLEDHDSIIRQYVEFLYDSGYITSLDPYILTKEHLTIKGLLATEVNEGHPILMAELYHLELLHKLSGEDLLTVLACFHEKKQTVSIDELNISQESYDCLLQIQKMADEFHRLDSSPYWSISTEMIEPISRWIHGEDSSVICLDYELFEGNFMRSILKIGNVVDEWLTMAIYCQHTDQVTKIMRLKEKMAMTRTDSLYLRL
jgi:superfamily II RNA helicase